MELSVLVGNPKAGSRTFTIAEAVAERIAASTGATVARKIDLCDHADDLFKWPHDGLAALNDAVASSTYLVVGSPTYKAAYTGLLKAFLDRYPSNGLAGVVAVPVMTGASLVHSMAIDTALRPVLVELGASVPTRGLFFEMSHMPEIGTVVDAWAEENMLNLIRAGVPA